MMSRRMTRITPESCGRMNIFSCMHAQGGGMPQAHPCEACDSVKSHIRQVRLLFFTLFFLPIDEAEASSHAAASRTHHIASCHVGCIGELMCSDQEN